MTETSGSGVVEAEPKSADDTTFTMQDWLEGSSDFQTFRRGEVGRGTIMAVQRYGLSG